MKFDDLSLCTPLLRSLQEAGYEEATPIQQKAIPQILKGRDLVGCAQTGTGKTAAFALPTLQQLMKPAAEPTGATRRRQRSGSRPIRCLILSPTRELAGQIGESLTTYGRFTGLRNTVIYGAFGRGHKFDNWKAASISWWRHRGVYWISLGKGSSNSPRSRF